ncbi:hypothetical protein C8J57DRAFT_1229906 [Mycena rebaudengoi]|nr:hypothetical protein C8J57DRAFT_1229906 [Mycena rebaudengoi]
MSDELPPVRREPCLAERYHAHRAAGVCAGCGRRLKVVGDVGDREEVQAGAVGHAQAPRRREVGRSHMSGAVGEEKGAGHRAVATQSMLRRRRRGRDTGSAYYNSKSRGGWHALQLEAVTARGALYPAGMKTDIYGLGVRVVLRAGPPGLCETAAWSCSAKFENRTTVQACSRLTAKLGAVWSISGSGRLRMSCRADPGSTGSPPRNVAARERSAFPSERIDGHSTWRHGIRTSSCKVYGAYTVLRNPRKICPHGRTQISNMPFNSARVYDGGGQQPE